MKLWADFRNILKYQISYKFVQWERVFLSGRTYELRVMQTNINDKAKSRFSQFCPH